MVIAATIKNRCLDVSSPEPNKTPTGSDARGGDNAFEVAPRLVCMTEDDAVDTRPDETF